MKNWKPIHTVTLGSVALAASVLAVPSVTRGQGAAPPPAFPFIDSQNGQGISRTITTNSSFDPNNPFFKPLGTNGRTCATCHPTGQGMTITPDYATQVFNATGGLDPLFATVDGTNSPNADMSTVDSRRANCSMLLSRGLIRIGLSIPANAEFTLAAVDDPYHFASASQLSCFRRPLPSTNLRFLSTVMWDGRERTGSKTVTDALKSQIKDAVLGHMQGIVPPTDSEIAQILDFETHLYTTQVYDDNAGDLDTPQIGAGPEQLVNLPFFPGINDAFGFMKNPQPFNPTVFDFYTGWLPAPPPPPGKPGGQGGPGNGGRGGQPGGPPPPPAPKGPQLTAYQASVARGETLFNTRTFQITDVNGLNDVLGKKSISGTCSSCHSLTHVGSNALPLLLNTGIADGDRRTPDLPLYTLKNKKTGQMVQTTDPGAALTSGKWSDIGKFKVPSLRGLETQSPYMHNGMSGDLADIIDFYDTRFVIDLTDQEKADLKAFLTTL